jgi:anti-anti-sigma regulatory factor
VAILDLTGVSAVDAATAEHLVRLVRAVELVGARAVVVGIRSEVARAVVSLGLDLGRVEVRASLRDALVGMIAPSLPRPFRRTARG